MVLLYRLFNVEVGCKLLVPSRTVAERILKTLLLGCELVRTRSVSECDEAALGLFTLCGTYGTAS